MAADRESARVHLQQQLGVQFSSLDQRLAGRLALISGAAQGIGRAIARRLAWEGADLLITDLEAQAEKLTELAAEAEAAGVQVEVVCGDATDRQSIEDVCRTTLDRFGRIDILINNVGGGILKPFLEKTEEMWQHELDLNLIPFMRYCEIVVPHMVERKYGRIVNIGAESVRNGLWEHNTYNAAKGGMHGMTTGLARELAQHGITVNTVAPSIVATERVQALFERGPNFADRYVDLIPIGRPAALGEVAATVAFAASDDASFITGQVISVNGGTSML